MKSLSFAFPGSIDTPTGGYRYDRRVVAELRLLGHTVDLYSLPDAFPDPSPADRAEATRRLMDLPADQPLIVDGLAFAPMPEEMAEIAARSPLIALIHHPLALETGLDPALADRLRASEIAALRTARAVIVTSPETARLLASDFGVTPDRITIAMPGTDVPAQTAAPRPPGPIRFLTVASLIPRKGYLDLVAAFAAMADLDWTADFIGGLSADPAHVAAIRAAIHAAGLDLRIRIHGPVEQSQLDSQYAMADCFVLASHYEGFGMAYTEAIARGLVVIGTTGGAIPEAIGDGGILIAPGDVTALTAKLRLVVTDATYRLGWAEKARHRANQLLQWTETAQIISAVIEGT